MVEMIQAYLKDEIELEYGKGLTKSERKAGKFPVYGSNGIVDFNDKSYFKGPGIIIGRKGTVGSVKYEEKDFWAIDTTYVVKLKNKNEDLRFWYYLLQTLGLENMNSHSAVPGLNRDRVYDIAISIPKYQKDRNRIANILSILDKKIEVNNQINKNLQNIITSIFNNLYNSCNSFEEKTLLDIAKEIITGKTPSTSKKEYWNGNIPFVTIPDMHNKVFTSKVERYITKEGSNSQIKKLLPKKSIMVSCIATVGLVSINPEKCHTNQQINSIITKNDYDLYYLYEVIKTKKEVLKNIGSGGSATLNVNKNEFEKINIKYPNKEVLLDFDKKVRTLFDRIELIEKENIQLEQIRDTLLPKLMNGEIDLKNLL